jgi:long-chain acyl-CoA synthetase
MAQQLISTLTASLKENWNSPVLSDFKGITLTASDIAQHIVKMHMLFKSAGIKPGDKIALCAKNSAGWATAFLASLTYGAVSVPILHDFTPDNIEFLINHSEARLLFGDSTTLGNTDFNNMPQLEGAVSLPDFTLAASRNEALSQAFAALNSEFTKLYPTGLTPNDINFHDIAPDTLALINYTSGSTGNPKGVMLSIENLWSNVKFGIEQIPFYVAGDGMVSMLPLAHMYGLVFEFIFPLCKGCHITFLGRVPSPKVVLDAFAQVKPKMIITVPLVIEKIVKGKVFPMLEKPTLRTLLAIPVLNNLVYAKIRKTLIQAFGGNLLQLLWGGAAMNDEVEKFLRRIKFPFTIGYGMTECAPLVTYEWWASQRPKSCGKMVDGMEARVESPNPQQTPGVLFVRGTNVMQGYWKNPEATAEALSADRWLNTGDICTIDSEGYIYLRGRNKNMILGPSGQNIYPEEIEVKVNNLPMVAESVVVDRNGKIVALVHPDYDLGHQNGLTDDAIDAQVIEKLPELNKQLPAYSRVSSFEIHRDAFEKTPKHSIRRFLYK